ncbi:MAG: RNA-binding protein [Armatimonadetes bacterium 13_1_40CM_3_65_7]|nr:MAG: RNA-binding protein [Armatimonadetes bacterium 13_1_40CM_3_65_7]
MAVRIVTADITLGDALKWAGITSTGGQAKVWIRSGRVQVNGIVERRRGRRLGPGDRIAVAGREYRVVGR